MAGKAAFEKGPSPFRARLEKMFGNFDHWWSWGITTEGKGWDAWTLEWDISRPLFLGSIYLGLMGVAWLLIPNLPLFALFWVAGTSPLWLPIVLWIGMVSNFVNYARAEFLSKTEGVLLEFKIPKDIFKSPRAMEQVINQFWIGSGEVTVIARAWKGSVRPWWSLEMASFGGEVHMYIWTLKKYRHLTETAFFGQFPEVQITEVEDYASKFRYDGKKHRGFVNDYRFKPNDGLTPMKTYVDWELDKDPKEEFRVDPIAGVFETLGSMRPHEQAWVQIIIRQLGKSGAINRVGDEGTWMKNIEKKIEKIREEAAQMSWSEDKNKAGFPHPTFAQTEQMRSLQRMLIKPAFEVVMRGGYLADTTRGSYDGVILTAVRWLYKSMNSSSKYYSLIRPARWHNPHDFPWNDFFDFRWQLNTRRWIDAYRRRMAFYTPWEVGNSMVFNSEMLASIWHFPSRGVQTPGLHRLPTTTAAPPPNLPR